MEITVGMSRCHHIVKRLNNTYDCLKCLYLQESATHGDSDDHGDSANHGDSVDHGDSADHGHSAYHA